MKINPQDHPDYVGGWIWTELEIRWIEELINKVAATEREACAEVVESFDGCEPKHIANAIRARGEK